MPCSKLCERIDANSDGLHYSDVAKTAMRQGYKGREGSDEKTVATSFAQIMHREKATFVSIGDGRFKLK